MEEITGYYYESSAHQGMNFLVSVDKITDMNCLVKIYSINDFTVKRNIGDEITEYDVDFMVEIDLWSKYFFPKFKDNRFQCYYGVKEVSHCNWQLDEETKEDEVKALADVMKYAIKLGLEKGNIKLY